MTVHEVSIMSDIVSAVLEELKSHDVKEVLEVEILVGDFLMLGEDQLSFAYELITQDTILGGSSLKMGREPIKIKCRRCGHVCAPKMIEGDGFGHDVPIMACPECGGEVEIIEGKSCRIISLNVVEAE